MYESNLILLLIFAIVCSPLVAIVPSGRVTDFFIRSHFLDGQQLVYFLRSVEAFVPRHVYRNIIMTYNERDDVYFQSFIPSFNLPIVLKPIDDGGVTEGYQAQIYNKMMAFTYTDADYIIFMDSDCMFTKQQHNYSFVSKDGAVYVKSVAYESLPAMFSRWRRPSEMLLGFPIENETMTGFPIVYPRVLLEEVHKHVEYQHRKPFKDVFFGIQGRNEFTPLGAYLQTKMDRRLWAHRVEEAYVVQQQSLRNGIFGPASAAYSECILRAKDNSQCRHVSRPPTNRRKPESALSRITNKIAESL